MITVSMDALNAKVLEYLRRVEETGEELVVMDEDVAVAKIVPVEPKRGPQAVFADVRGRVKYHGDLLESTTDEWVEV